MKKLITLTTILFSIYSHANLAPVSCRINYTDGAVYLTVKDLNDGQIYESFLGKENFLEPYSFRNLCKQLMPEFDLVPKFSWDDFGCAQNGSGEKYFHKGLDLKLSEKGRELLENTKEEIHFYSVNSMESNTKTIFDNSCIWY